MRTKKTVRLLACGLILLLSAALCCPRARAQTLPQPEPGSVICRMESGSWYETADGKAVDVTVSVMANPGLAGYTVELHYDHTALTATKAVYDLIPWLVNPDIDGANRTGTLRIPAAQDDNTEGGGNLFTVTFVQKGGAVGPSEVELYLALDVDRGFKYTHYTETGDWRIDSLTVDTVNSTPTLTLLLDGLRFTKDAADSLTLADGCISGTASATVLSCGEGYSGAALAVLCCYQDGRMVGVETLPVQVQADDTTEITFADVSFQTQDGAGAVTAKLFLLQDIAYAPLAEMLTWDFALGGD